MICQWNKLQNILPRHIVRELDADVRENCQEIRLRLDEPPVLNLGIQQRKLNGTVTREDIDYVINTASRYSPWTAATIREGYLTAPGGHRIGVCGEAVMRDGQISAMRQIRSVCIRVARDFPGAADKLRNIHGSVLILGAPGWGKTTLLRDLIRQRSAAGACVAVVDEREELFPPGTVTGTGIDILSGCPKREGIEILLKTMGPQSIAVDEITSLEDAQALLRAFGCGVSLLATIHAASIADLEEKAHFRPFLSGKVFDVFVILHPDKSWHWERRSQWN